MAESGRTGEDQVDDADDHQPSASPVGATSSAEMGHQTVRYPLVPSWELNSARGALCELWGVGLWLGSIAFPRSAGRTRKHGG